LEKHTEQEFKRVSSDEVLFRAFDIMIGEELITYDLFVEICDAVGLVRVPEVWRGKPTVAAFDALLERPSQLAALNGVTGSEDVSEGVVVRANPLIKDVHGDYVMIKHKSQKFMESTRRDMTLKPNSGLEPALEFAANNVLEGRILNVLGHLKDNGVAIKNDISDMQYLVRAVVDDVQKECEEEWQELVSNSRTSDKQIRSAVSQTLRTVYQKMLFETVAQ
jgi:hypothetical protein